MLVRSLLFSPTLYIGTNLPSAGVARIHCSLTFLFWPPTWTVTWCTESFSLKRTPLTSTSVFPEFQARRISARSSLIPIIHLLLFLDMKEDVAASDGLEVADVLVVPPVCLFQTDRDTVLLADRRAWSPLFKLQPDEATSLRIPADATRPTRTKVLPRFGPRHQTVMPTRVNSTTRHWNDSQRPSVGSFSPRSRTRRVS